MKHGKLIALAGFVLALLGCVSPQARQPAVPYFTGPGGSGMRLGILVPESNGLNENQAYLPRMVQGALVSNISRHSAISVLDRVSLDRVILETLDPTYEDNLDIVRLGHVAHVAYMMTGSITRSAAGYVLQINVTDTTPNANTIASYSGIHAAAQLNDFSAVNNASMELLEQMGVELTAASVNRLSQASGVQDIGAQTNLARGIVAQQRGTIVEALVHYHNAVSFDPRLPEATERLSVLSTRVSSGNIGEDVRNEIQLRNEWMRVLAEAEEFFTAHVPFELFYSASLTQGRIDFARETVELTTPIALSPSQSSFAVFNHILRGLEETGRRGDWGFAFWPTQDRREGIQYWLRAGSSGVFSHRANRRYFPRDDHTTAAEKSAEVTAVLLDKDGTIVSTARVILNSYIRFAASNRHRMHFDGRTFNVDTSRLEASADQRVLSFTVNAHDITDRLTIKIVSVNGVDVAQNPGFIKIRVREDGFFNIQPLRRGLDGRALF